ncbi:hypothetical protein F7734_06570 [Scytonema sp. UIC 10036]|uniref:hypothetical protein n=1 Tax=Scytonema sp. UIC 10036 TaxID=2304196 RepID=UPI0012DADDF0|nr:hypothetical protein [Scytonema sp. UIC 10036]MUG92140.1 hypothetical protein [Scytonema sp. UIC 10036]
MTTENTFTQSTSSSGFSQSPFGRLGDAVGNENLPGFPGGGGTQSGGEGSNQFAGGGTPVSPFDQIRYNIDQAIYTAFPPGGGTPAANTNIDTSTLNPFNQPPGGGSPSSRSNQFGGGTQTGSGEEPSFGGYNPFNPGFGSNISNQAIQASSGSNSGSQGGFDGANQGGFGDVNQGGFGGGSQAGGSFAGNQQASQIDAIRFGLTDSITQQVSNGNPDKDAIDGEIGSTVDSLVRSYTGIQGGTSSSIDAGSEIPSTVSVELVPVVSEVSESVFTEQPLTEFVVTDTVTVTEGNADILTNSESVAFTSEEQIVYDFLKQVSGDSIDPFFVKSIDSGATGEFAKLINQYAETGSLLGSGSNQSTDAYLSQLQSGFISNTSDSTQFGGSDAIAL